MWIHALAQDERTKCCTGEQNGAGNAECCKRLDEAALRRAIRLCAAAVSVDGSLTGYENCSFSAKLYDIPHKNKRSASARNWSS